MKFSTVTVAAVAAVCAAAPSNPKAVKFPFTKRVIDSRTSSLDSREVSNPLINLPNKNVYYSILVSYGTPPQTYDVALDTGSSENWVRQNGSPGSFDPSKSSTYQLYQPGKFWATYGSGDTSTGDYVKDTLRVGDVTLDNYIFGAAKKTSGPQFFGVGLKSFEFTADKYDNFPVRLAKDGYTNTVAYSLYLDSRFAASGSILFGAVDTSKFEDGLALLPLVKRYSSDAAPHEFHVTLDGIELGGENLLPETRQVLLDSGTTVTKLPTTVYWDLVNRLGLYVTSNSVVLASQTQYDKWTQDQTNITYNFQGKKINVQLTQLFQPRSDYVTTSPGHQEKAYGWGVEASDNNDRLIFGDTFLRSAYVAFDLDNLRVGLGQAKYDDSEEKIVAISSDGIPSATAPPQTATWSTNVPITGTVAKPTYTAALGPKTV